MAIPELVAGPEGDAGNSTGAQVASSVNAVIDAVEDAVSGNAALNAYLKSLRVDVQSPPVGFNWPAGLPEVIAYKNGDAYSCNIRPEDLIDFSVFTNTQYVDINRPDSSGDGLSWATAEKGIGHAIDNAIASGQPTRILVRGGIYPRAYSLCNANLTKTLTAPISIESVYGDVTTGTFDDLTYTKTVGQDYVYQATRSNVGALIDPSVSTLRANGKLYTLVSSIAECNSTQGSFYTDATTLYVHSFDSSEVNNGNCIAALNAIGGSVFGNYDIYLSGLTLLGGSGGALEVKNGSTNTVVANRCSFNLAVSGASDSAQTPKDGVQILGCKLFAAFNCDASLNSKDGFNLHIQGAVEPAMLTVNCTGFDNGQIVSASQSNNGITVHDGLKAIDIGSTWLGSVGTNAGHISDGTQVWHFGAIAGQSNGDVYNSGSINYGGFGVWSGAAEMWLDWCTDYSTSIGITAGGTANAYVRNHSGTGARSGNITTY